MARRLKLDNASGYVIAGDPGERWRNETGEIRYQLIANLSRSCGYCIFRHRMICSWWDIPFHENCRCMQAPIMAGDLAYAFADPMAIVRRMPKYKQKKVFGKSTWALIDSGAVDMRDAVRDGRVLSLREVVREGKIPVAKMRRAGIEPHIVESVWRDVGPEIAAAKGARKAAKAEKEAARKAADLAKFGRTIDGLRKLIEPARRRARVAIPRAAIEHLRGLINI